MSGTDAFSVCVRVVAPLPSALHASTPLDVPLYPAVSQIPHMMHLISSLTRSDTAVSYPFAMQAKHRSGLGFRAEDVSKLPCIVVLCMVCSGSATELVRKEKNGERMCLCVWFLLFVPINPGSLASAPPKQSRGADSVLGGGEAPTQSGDDDACVVMMREKE